MITDVPTGAAFAEDLVKECAGDIIVADGEIRETLMQDE